jgi:SAM-dependent methyltransferase
MTTKSVGEASRVSENQRVSCILCGAGDVEIVDTFPFRSLRQLWFDTCEVDIATCLQQPLDDSDVHIYRCGKCELEFYPPSLCGTARLYQALGSFSYYYTGDRWEFDRAAEDLGGRRSVLEIGCGTGLFLERLVREDPSRSAVGLERNPDAMGVARQKGLRVEARSVEEFAPDHAERFDVVCAFQVLEHLATPDAFLKAAFHCLRPGGLCLLSVPNREGFTRHTVNDFGNMPPHHITRWSSRVMRNIAGRYEATVERVLEEPVAEYHKAWYRDTLTVRAVSAAVRLRWGRVEVGTRYRLMLGLCRRLQRVIPERLWRYNRYPGHTLYVALRKCLA